jgi:DNA-binding NarL/FixJ family response regulator
MIEVFIVDDHAIVREGVKMVLKQYKDISVVAEAQNGQQAFSYILDNSPDVVVMDLSMPGLNGLDSLKQIKKYKPNIPVIIFTMHPEEHYALRVLKSGGNGYLTKETAGTELAMAIRAVYNGERYIMESLRASLGNLKKMEKLSEEQEVHEILSDREYQIMCALAQGNNVTAIGEQLHLSVKTISTYRSRILKKMHFKGNSDIISYCVRNNLID